MLSPPKRGTAWLSIAGQAIRISFQSCTSVFYQPLGASTGIGDRIRAPVCPSPAPVCATERCCGGDRRTLRAGFATASQGSRENVDPED